MVSCFLLLTVILHYGPANKLSVTCKPEYRGKIKSQVQTHRDSSNHASTGEIAGGGLEPPCQGNTNLQLPDERPGYGGLPKVRPYTSRALDRAMEVAATLDLLCPPEECIFFTGTFPSRVPDCVAAVARYSAHLRKQFTNWARKHVGKDLLYLFKWEPHKDGALHYHAVVHAPCEDTRNFLISRFKERHLGWIEGIGKLANLDMWARTDGQDWVKDKEEVIRTEAVQVQTSASGYVAKYIAKELVAGGTVFTWTPVRWCSWARGLAKAVGLHSACRRVHVPTEEAARDFVAGCLEKLTEKAEVVRTYLEKYSELPVVRAVIRDRIELTKAFDELANAKGKDKQDKKDGPVAKMRQLWAQWRENRLRRLSGQDESITRWWQGNPVGSSHSCPLPVWTDILEYDIYSGEVGYAENYTQLPDRVYECHLGRNNCIYSD